MQTLFALLLVIISAWAHFLVSEYFGLFQHYPWFSYLGILAGTGIIVWRTVQKFTFLRLAAMLLSLSLAGGFVWYTLDYSEYDRSSASLSPGENADSSFLNIQVESDRGEPVILGEVLGTYTLTLLVLNRGVW